MEVLVLYDEVQRMPYSRIVFFDALEHLREIFELRYLQSFLLLLLIGEVNNLNMHDHY